MQITPPERVPAFRPLGAEQLTLSAQAQAVAAQRPQPVAEVDTQGPDGQATDGDRANTESLVRQFTQRLDEATYDRRLLEARRDQSQALDARLEASRQAQGVGAAAPVTDRGPTPNEAATPSSDTAGRGVAAVAPVAGAQQRPVAAIDGRQRVEAAPEVSSAEPVQSQRPRAAEPQVPVVNGAAVPPTPSGEPLASRPPRISPDGTLS